MPYHSEEKPEACPVCGSPANILNREFNVAETINCSRCGDFSISHSASVDCLPLQDPKQRALASHIIRKLQGAIRPNLTSDFFQILSQRSLPTPAEASDNLLLWLAEQVDGRPGKLVSITYDDPSLLGLIGVVDLSDIQWIVQALASQGLLGGSSAMVMHHGNLTARGWQRVEQLKRAHVASRFAFFARKFQNADLNRVFDNCLRPAVAQTGFELRTVTQRAGLVDSIIEDEICRCRFLIADLSDENAGAYWEAGFAEGLGKPVFYVCRATNAAGEQVTTHFDANHRHTVRWDLSALERTAQELKAVIRNTLLGDAKQDD